MVQEQSSGITIAGREFSLGQVLFGALAALIILFLIIGTLNQPAEPTGAIQLAPSDSFVVLALIAFAGGLFSFLSPCTLPILPAYFAFAFRGGRSTIVANTFAFMLGLATMFSLLGAGASALGSVLFTNSNLLLLIGGSLIIIFGIMSVVGQGFSGMQAMTQNERTTSVGGSFVFGLTFAVGWSSCVGPILGIVLSLAAATASVTQGIMLLFIYALGLGLPLMLVSALFGRAPRDSFIWRAMRGRGWDREVPTWVFYTIWALGLWLILMPVISFAIPSLNLDATPVIDISNYFFGFTIGLLDILLLVALVAGAFVWSAIQGGAPTTTLHLHSTSLISGALFLLMGLLLLNNQLSVFNSLAESDLSLRLLDLEDSFLEFISR